MTSDRILFRVAALNAMVPEGVPIQWMGQEIPSGPLTIELDDGPTGKESRGELDYVQHRAQAEFHVRIRMSELTDVLSAVGVDPQLTRPVRAVVCSQGQILDDHSFALTGPCEIQPHDVFGGTEANMLPGQ
jgi:hypothetical protein